MEDSGDNRVQRDDEESRGRDNEGERDNRDSRDDNRDSRDDNRGSRDHRDSRDNKDGGDFRNNRDNRGNNNNGENPKIYISGDAVGKDGGIETADLEEAFEKFGKIDHVWVGRRPAGFAFVTYENPSDCQVAIEKMNGEEIKGCVVTVEMARRRDRGTAKPGDWKCVRCDVNNFARRNECFRCGSMPPRGFNRFEGRRGRSASRGRFNDRRGGGGGGFRGYSRERRDFRDDRRDDRGYDRGYDRRDDRRDDRRERRRSRSRGR